MKVKDLILYQISTDRHYKVGDKLEFGKEYNYQGQRVYGGVKLDKRKACEDGYTFVDSKKIFANKNLVLDMSNQLDEYDFILREIAFEDVRKKEFKDRPSRVKCMFLTDNKEYCLKKIKTFYMKGHGTFFQVVAVKLNGDVFYVSEKNAIRAGLSYNDYVEMAREYWSQNQNSNSPISEILFEGKAEIVEVIDEYEYKK